MSEDEHEGEQQGTGTDTNTDAESINTASHDKLIRVQSILSAVYNPESFSAAQAISREARDQFTTSVIAAMPLMYGETSIATIAWILSKCELPSSLSLSFADLGCGSGLALAAAALLQPRFASLIGIERVTQLCELARDRIRSLSLASRVTVVESDFLTDTQWVSSDVVFACATAFSETMISDIAMQCERMRVGSYFAILSHPLHFRGDLFALVASTESLVTWGAARCFVYRKSHNRRLESVILRSFKR